MRSEADPLEVMNKQVVFVCIPQLKNERLGFERDDRDRKDLFCSTDGETTFEDSELQCESI